jgi:hypothetical protein
MFIYKTNVASRCDINLVHKFTIITCPSFISYFIVANITSRDISLSLYQFACHHVVGTEETVKTKRTFNTIRDYMSVSEQFIRITSGSFGEGLEQEEWPICLHHFRILAWLH